MAKEYIYENTDDGYKIEWDKVELSVQESRRDINNAGADYAIDHEIYCDYYGEQIGYLHFSEFKNVNAKNVHQSLLDKNYEQLIYINNILVNSEFRGWGIGSKLYDKFGELYKQNFNDWPIAQVFINPIAEYSFKKAIERGSIPETAFVEELTTRDYNETEKQKAKELFNWLPKEEQEDFKDKMEKLKEVNANIFDRRAFSWLKNLKMEKTSAVGLLDARQVEVVHSTEGTPQDALDAWGAGKFIKHFIELFTSDGSLIGFIQFFEVENISLEFLQLSEDPNEIIEKAIYIQLVEVDEQFKNNGFAYKIYEEFGKFYTANFSGWPVGRNFINPVAEYSFRKAVEKGLVPEETMTEDLIKRDYDTEEKKNQAKDLRNKLPEHVRGPEQWASTRLRKLKKQATAEIDLRNLTFDVSRAYDYVDIIAMLNGQQVGILNISIFNKKQSLFVEHIEVDNEFRNFGIGQLLYKEFGILYETEFSNWRIERFFVNPIAEYSFRKAVSLGWFPQEILNEDSIQRSTSPQRRDLWTDLRNKLPEEVRGPEQWAARKDYRMKKIN